MMASLPPAAIISHPSCQLAWRGDPSGKVRRTDASALASLHPWNYQQQHARRCTQTCCQLILKIGRVERLEVDFIHVYRMFHPAPLV